MATVIGPLTAISIDPLNPSHVKELTKQRIACGWLAEKVPRMLNEIKAGTRWHYLYHETATNKPIGSGAISTTIHHGPPLNPTPNTPKTVYLSNGFIYPEFRGQGFANICHEHRRELSFGELGAERIVIDTPVHFTEVREWHRRIGYTVFEEDVSVFETEEDMPEYLRERGYTRKDFVFVFEEITKKAWMEWKMRARERWVVKQNHEKGIPSNSRTEIASYTEVEADQFMNAVTEPITAE